MGPVELVEVDVHHSVDFDSTVSQRRGSAPRADLAATIGVIGSEPEPVSGDDLDTRRRALSGQGWLTRDGQLLDSAEKLQTWLDKREPTGPQAAE